MPYNAKQGQKRPYKAIQGHIRQTRQFNTTCNVPKSTLFALAQFMFDLDHFPLKFPRQEEEEQQKQQQSFFSDL